MTPLAWLLACDPAIRWQAMRDLSEVSASDLAKERARVAHEGVGAAILAAQGADGAWHREGAPDWLPTLFTFQLLRATGVDPADTKVGAAVERVATGFRWDESLGHGFFFEGETEPCINGGTLALGAYFGRPSPRLLDRLLSEQLDDGGWNCEAPKSKRSSYHSTICVLEGLLEYERAAGASPATSTARSRAEEYLLERALFRRRSTGAVASSTFLELVFPPRYEYGILRALDYFRSAGRAPEPRMAEALALLESRREADGRYRLDRSHPEALAVPLGESAGQASPWNTLRALRISAWFHGNPSSTGDVLFKGGHG